MKKLISRWFIIKPNKELEALQFRKDEKGKDVFYPWGFSGEAFYLNEKQKKRMLIFFGLITILFCVSTFGYIFADVKNLINSNLENYFMPAVFMFFSLIYIFGVYIFIRKANLYVIPKDERALSKKIIFLWFGLICSQAQAFFVTQEDRSLVFLGISIVYVLFITYFFIKIKITKGYFFNK